MTAVVNVFYDVMHLYRVAVAKYTFKKVYIIMCKVDSLLWFNIFEIGQIYCVLFVKIGSSLFKKVQGQTEVVWK